MIDWAEREDRPERRRFHRRVSLACVVRAAVLTLLTAALIIGYLASAQA